jgi:cytochrome b
VSLTPATPERSGVASFPVVAATIDSDTSEGRAMGTFCMWLGFAALVAFLALLAWAWWTDDGADWL